MHKLLGLCEHSPLILSGTHCSTLPGRGSVILSLYVASDVPLALMTSWHSALTLDYQAFALSDISRSCCKHADTSLAI